MKHYKVSFWLNNRRLETLIQAGDYYQAKKLIQAQYYGATNIFVQEIKLN